MTPLAIFLCILAQLFLVAGQLFFKRAMNEATPMPGSRKLGILSIGIACQTVWFFLWLRLLQKWDLSRVFPFEGLDPLLLVLAAWLVLRERLTVATWVGVGLISAGIVVVAT